jgi:hypothetical protein
MGHLIIGEGIGLDCAQRRKLAKHSQSAGTQLCQLAFGRR